MEASTWRATASCTSSARMECAGRSLSATTPPVVRHPNRLALVAPDRLDVVDTDRSRIVTFEVSAKGVGPMVGERSTRSRLSRYGRILPFDAERLPDGSTAVLI